MEFSISQKHACEYYGLSLHGSSCCWFGSRLSEVSRFLCIKLTDMSGVFDYEGPSRTSRLRPRSCHLPPTQKRHCPACILFGAQSPVRLYPNLRFAAHLTVSNTKLGAEWFECTGTCITLWT